MDLVESDNGTEKQTTTRQVTQTAVEPEPSGIAWLRVVALIFLAIILIALIVFFARWVYHKVHHASVNAPAVTTQQQLQGPANDSETGTQSSDSTSSGTSPSPSGTSTNPQTNQSNNLPNNGPGNVAAVFIGTSLAAAGIHYAITHRRLNRSGV